jgi:hypothetical protein
VSAARYTPDEERRYELVPLPDPAPVTPEEAARLNAAYEADRLRYRAAHPHAVKGEG